LRGQIKGQASIGCFRKSQNKSKQQRKVKSQDDSFDFSGFVFFWGIVFVVSTTLVLIFKHEIDYSVADNATKE
jgi:hypothetical protein